jgi:hypothetical protein
MRKKTPDKVGIIDQERFEEWIGGKVPVPRKTLGTGESGQVRLDDEG